MNTTTCSIWDSDPGLSLSAASATALVRAAGRAVAALAAPRPATVPPTKRRRDISGMADLRSTVGWGVPVTGGHDCRGARRTYGDTGGKGGCRRVEYRSARVWRRPPRGPGG